MGSVMAVQVPDEEALCLRKIQLDSINICEA